VSQSPSPTLSINPVNKWWVGLTHEQRDWGKLWDIGLNINSYKKNSVYVNFERNMGHTWFILSGSFVAWLETQQQKILAKDIALSPQYLETQKICQELNLQLKNDKSAFTAKYGISREQGKIDDSILQLWYKYSNRNRTLRSSVVARDNDGNFKFQQAIVWLSGKVLVQEPNIWFNVNASIVYQKNPDGKIVFIPKIGVTKTF
jgi:hypothetical protein